MKTILKKLLRFYAMCHMKHHEDYYKTALISDGVDVKKLTHLQIATFKAAIKVTEAEMIIQYAFNSKFIQKQEVTQELIFPIKEK